MKVIYQIICFFNRVYGPDIDLSARRLKAVYIRCCHKGLTGVKIDLIADTPIDHTRGNRCRLIGIFRTIYILKLLCIDPIQPLQGKKIALMHTDKIGLI